MASGTVLWQFPVPICAWPFVFFCTHFYCYGYIIFNGNNHITFNCTMPHSLAMIVTFSSSGYVTSNCNGLHGNSRGHIHFQWTSHLPATATKHLVSMAVPHSTLISMSHLIHYSLGLCKHYRGIQISNSRYTKYQQISCHLPLSSSWQ